MATPPFDLDTSNPADNAQEKNYPENERAFRDTVASYIGWEHDIDSGHHAILNLTTTGRDAITDWVAGSFVINTDAYAVSGTGGGTGFQAVLQFFDGTTWYTIGPIPGVPTWEFITGSGTFLIMAPTLNITLIGAGAGGGGGSLDAATPTGGGGGGAGSMVFQQLVGLTPGNTLTIAIGGAGAAGTGGAPGTAGTNGGNTVLSSGTETIISVTAGGGVGGTAGVGGPNNGGAAGAPSGGSGNFIPLTGQGGSAGYSVSATFGTPGAGGLISSKLGGFGYGGRGGRGEVVVGENGANGIQGCCLVEWITI